MLTRIALLAAPLLAVPASAQVAAPPSTAPVPAAAEDLVPVAIDTSAGRIVIALDRGHAPITTANFLHYVDTHRLDGESFYRAMHVGDGGLIQGGITSDARKLYPPIADEPTSKTGLHNSAGAISMARGAPGSATADFFILLSDMPAFDAGGAGGDPDGFAAFGYVTDGMDVVRKILAAPVSSTKGLGPMKGQMLDPTVKIIKAQRLK
jgi:peptidyl-prolyl cis-trans isomerase A (cyclophilin A)